MRPVQYPSAAFLAPIAASATVLGASQAGTAGVALVLASTVLDVARQVIITSAADESAHSFTITGTNWFGAVISEVLLGANVGVATSVNSYKTVTSIVPVQTTTGNVTLGTNGVATTPPIVVPPAVGITLSVKVTGTVNYSVQQTFDSPWVSNPDTLTWVPVVAGLTAQTANAQAASTQLATAYRLVSNSNTAPGGAQLTVIPPTSAIQL